MEEWQEQAIVLRLGQFRETDVWLRVLLEKHGLQTIFAFGGMNSRRRFCGCLDQFNTLACRIASSRNGSYLNLREAELLRAPVSLRQNWRDTGMAANCLRFVEACAGAPENAGACFELLEDLRELVESGAAPAATPVFFRLRLAAVMGYAPDFIACAQCGAPLAPWGVFAVDEGRCFCPGCSPRPVFREGRRGMRLTPGALDLLQNVKQNPPRFWSAAAADGDLRQARRAIDGFVQYHLGLYWDNGNFRRI